MTRFVLALAVVSLGGGVGIARADNILEAAGGVMIPVADSDYTDYVESSPKLALRAGSTGHGKLGGLLSADWTPYTTDDQGFGNLVDVSAYRLRFLLNLVAEQHVGTKLVASVRVGAGVDVTHVRIKTNLGAFSSDQNDFDPGLAIEAAAGLWFQAGSSIQLGGEVALPIAFHSDDNSDEIDLNDYSSLDVDILFGVRYVTN